MTESRRLHVHVGGRVQVEFYTTCNSEIFIADWVPIVLSDVDKRASVFALRGVFLLLYYL